MSKRNIERILYFVDKNTIKKITDDDKNVIKSVIKKTPAHISDKLLITKFIEMIDYPPKLPKIGKAEKTDTMSLVSVKDIFDIPKESISKSINWKSKIKSHYLFLDLDNTDTDLFDSSETRATWIFNPNAILSKGVISSIGNVENIVGMRLDSINLPTNWVGSDEFQNEKNNQNILIEEFSSQSFILTERRFHFYLITNTVDVPSYTSPREARGSMWEYRISNNGYYMFDSPIRKLDSITVSFGEGNKVVPFPRTDVYFGTTNTYITPGNPTVISTYGNHFMINGNTIIIKNFTTDDPTTDAAVINEVNKSAGHTITYVSLTSFSIPVDSTGITLSTTDTVVTGICISKKVAMGLELFTVED